MALAESDPGLVEARRAYARTVMETAGVSDPRLEAAFATIRREDFLGPGPWWVVSGGRYVRHQSTDPRHVLQDRLVALDADRGLNNGQPSFYAFLLAALAPKPGEAVIHVGAGTGYYSALLAALVGPTGHVRAIEQDAGLAAAAARNLASFPQVAAECGAAAELPTESADAILVSAGATYPPPGWVDALRVGGRMILPLTLGSDPAGVRSGHGVVLLITRLPTGWAARIISGVAIWPATGARRAEDEPALLRALEKGSAEFVRGLHRGPGADPARCWLWRPDWALTYDQP